MQKPLFVLGLCLLTGCGSAPSGNELGFEMELSLASEENSEDSNSVTELLTLDGGRGHYEWHYDGYHPDENFDTDREEDFELTQEEVDGLKLYIKDQSLNQDLEETQSMSEMGRAVKLNLTMTIDGEETTMHLEGMSDVWPSSDEAGNLVNIDYVGNVEQLIYMVKDLGGLYEE